MNKETKETKEVKEIPVFKFCLTLFGTMMMSGAVLIFFPTFRQVGIDVALICLMCIGVTILFKGIIGE